MTIPQPLDALNERELELIPLLAEGLSNKEIAERLFLASSTVKWYVRQINSKLGTASRDEIAEQADKLGLMQAKDAGQTYVRPRTNLPRHTTAFIGRDHELEEIHRIIEREDVRLLTILAPGGMGKTRVALEAAEQQMNHYPDGVYFVPLQPLTNVANIVPQIAAATGLQFSNDGSEPKHQLLDFLSDKQLLLVMDNWEHLLEGVLLVNNIIADAPHVKVLCTSREKLNLLGETVYVLHGMQFPDWETPEDALEYDAVQLLVDSAKRNQPDWAVTDENLNYVARICRLTEGMPLGILLATSWLDVYSLERIAEEVQKSADILETDMRDVPERQRSIRAVFEYSWNELKPEDKDVLMRMSIFRGGCTPQAAETIAGANGRILQTLVNKALLTRNKQGRYDIHELLRQYAEYYFIQTDIGDDVRDSHMTYYAAAVQEREAHLQDSRQLAAVHAISGDFENVRAAWLRAVERNRFDLTDKMQFTLQIFVRFRTRYKEIHELLELASQQMSAHSEDILPLMWARAETGRADLRHLLGDFSGAEQILRVLLPILREFGRCSITG